MIPRPDNSSRLRSWIILASVLFSVWIFAVYLGPWLENHIPLMDEIVKVVEEQDINANAYFYTEIEASSDGEQFLRGSLEHTGRDDYGVTFAFISGVILCILILFFGYWFMPL